MRLPHLREWYSNHQVSKIRDQYRYSLEALANRHKAEKSKEDKFLIGGLCIYVAIPIIATLSGFYFLVPYSIFAFMGAAFFPFIMSFWEQYQLAKKLTLTMKIVANNPEETRPLTIRMQGVEFGAPMSTSSELTQYILSLGGHLSTAMCDTIDAAVMTARDADMKLYPMMARGDTVPTLTMWPDDPEKCLRAREEKVRLSYGIGKVRHATVYMLECRPVQTSIKARDKILDVEYALFIPFFSQHDIDAWIAKSDWFVPNRVAQEVATYVKQQADMTKNASFFGTLERQRDDAVASLDRALLHQQFMDVQADVEGDVLAKFRQKKSKEDYFVYIVLFGMGLCMGLLLPFGG